MIRQPFDKYCCGGGIPECEDRPPQPCGARVWNNSQGESWVCNDPKGKVAMIGCMIGFADRQYSDYTIQRVTARNPQDKESGGQPINQIQREFAFGLSSTYKDFCPVGTTFSDITLEEIYALPAVPKIQGATSRIYVDVDPTAVPDTASVNGVRVDVYANCSDPLDPATCQLLQKNEFGADDGYNTGAVTNVTVPEPGVALSGFAAFVALAAMGRKRSEMGG